ncbi:MAG: hypothetical protein GW949_00805 [Spirochaetales bacterium]|nr:hypothetical protein [Spirochaetales bacterium]
MRTRLNRKSLLLFFVLSGTLLTVNGQSFSEMGNLTSELGEYQVFVNPVSGSFSISYRVSSDSLVLLVKDGYPYGSQFRLSQGGRILRLDEIVRFSQVLRSDDSLLIYYELRELGSFSVSFRLLEEGNLALSLGVVNISDDIVHAQILLDTELGEASGTHFILNGTPVNRETGFVLNPQQSDLVVGQGIETGVDTGVPSTITPYLQSESQSGAQVVLANIRRLAESPETFSVNPNRNFNLLPFSVNDSALMISSTIQPSSRSAFGLGLSRSLLSPKMVPTALDQTINPSAPQISNSSVSNGNSPSTQATIPSFESSSEGVSIEIQRLTENLQDLNLLLMKIEQQLLNPSQNIDLDSFQQQLDTIRRGSGL